jgi:putative membrane protein
MFTVARLRATVAGATLTGALLFTVLMIGAAPAQAAPSAQDSKFLQAAHQSNLAEIAVGQLAQQKATSQAVRDLGARFVADHTQLDQALKQTASALGVTLPNAPTADQQAVARRLQAASGSAFDQLFVSTQLAGHMTAMRLGQTELSAGSDPQAKKVAADSAPVIKSHHDALTSAAAAVGVPGDVNTGSGGQAAPHRPYLIAALLVVLGVLLLGVGARRLRPAHTGR